VKRFVKSKIIALVFAILLTGLFSRAASASGCVPVYYQASEEPCAYEVCELILAIVYPDGSEQCEYDCHLEIEY